VNVGLFELDETIGKSMVVWFKSLLSKFGLMLASCDCICEKQGQQFEYHGNPIIFYHHLLTFEI
jgi:hypothetical protein